MVDPSGNAKEHFEAAVITAMKTYGSRLDGVVFEYKPLKSGRFGTTSPDGNTITINSRTRLDGGGFGGKLNEDDQRQLLGTVFHEVQHSLDAKENYRIKNIAINIQDYFKNRAGKADTGSLHKELDNQGKAVAKEKFEEYSNTLDSINKNKEQGFFSKDLP